MTGARRAVLAFSFAAAALAAPAEAAVAGGAGPLPALQGLEAQEVYSVPFPDDTIIDRYVAGFLASRRDWLQAVLDRSRRWRQVILPAIEARGLPRELLWLPAVESGFEPRALSPRGAAGLWQLMVNTASPYGLRMDQWVDERRDVWRASEASLSKLAENERIFGDWDLALAAYNCGVGKLSAIMRTSPGLDYWGLRRKGVLPRETAAFVPQFLALVRILSYPGRYDLAVNWDPPPTFERIPLEGCVDLRLLAQASGVPLAVLSGANPGLNFSITPPGSYRWELTVPTEDAAAVKAALASATVPLMNFLVHVIVSGDTLSELAQSYGVTVEMLQEFNPRATPRALPLGLKLLVPMAPVKGGR